MTLDYYRNLITGEQCTCCKRKYTPEDLLYARADTNPQGVHPLGVRVDDLAYPVVIWAHCTNPVRTCRSVTTVQTLLARKSMKVAAMAA